MNTTQAKAFYKKVDLAKLPADVRKELEKFDKDTKGFTNMNAQDFTDFKEIKELIEGAFPQAIEKAKGSKAKVAAKKVIKAKGKKTQGTRAKAAKRKDGLTAVSKSKPAATPKAAAPKKVAAPKKAKTPRVKAAPKPKAVRKVSATKSKAEKAMEAKRARFDKMTKELKEYKAILRDNDKVKMEIAKDAQRQYNKIVSLGKTKFDMDYEKLVIEHKLFKAFVATDKGKFKSIRVKAVGKVEPSLGKAKKPAKKKVKKATKKKAPETKSKGFFGRLFS